MRLVVLGSSTQQTLAIAGMAQAHGCETVCCRVPQEFCSALVRDPEAVGVFSVMERSLVAYALTDWREAGMRAKLMVLLDFKTVTHADMASALNVGADDAQPIGIHWDEFFARLQALDRRDDGWVPMAVALPNGAIFDRRSGIIQHRLGRFYLTGKETALLDLLARRAGVVITHDMAMDHLYGGLDEPEPKVLDVVICKIRKRLADVLDGVEVIETIWGRGWKFVPEGFEPTFIHTRKRA